MNNSTPVMQVVLGAWLSSPIQTGRAEEEGE